MAYTFLKAKGLEVGKSLVDLEQVDYCKEMMEKAEKLGKKLLLPVDTVVCDHFPDPIDGPVDTEVVDVDKIPSDKEGLDIGTKTGELFASEVRNAKTVVWNGPMGVFENPTLARGTNEVAKALADFPAIVEKASEKFEPSIIAKYALDLSKKFNKYYANVRILDEDDQLNARLALVQATSIVLTEALRLLGVNAPKEM